MGIRLSLSVSPPCSLLATAGRDAFRRLARLGAAAALCLAALCLAALCLAAAPKPARAQPAVSTPGRDTPPQPPPRPFDLRVFQGSGPVAPVPRPPEASPAPGAVAAPTEEQPEGRRADPPGRLVTGAPTPPQRPAIAPQSNPEDEEEEPQPWPRRTPEQRNLPFEPRIEPAPAVGVNGITTDPGTSISCLPPPLRRVLAAIVQRYGAAHVTSTWRPAWRARRNSFHRRCEAVDMRVPGQNPRAVLDFVKTLPETGGHKVYWNGLVHVDTGPWRTW